MTVSRWAKMAPVKANDLLSRSRSEHAAMTANGRTGRGLHGGAGGSEEALEEGVWGRNLAKVSHPLARPKQNLPRLASTTPSVRPAAPKRVSRVCRTCPAHREIREHSNEK